VVLEVAVHCLEEEDSAQIWVCWKGAHSL